MSIIAAAKEESKHWQAFFVVETDEFHIIPYGDDMVHVVNDECNCFPVMQSVLETEDGGLQYIYAHNSLDGREIGDENITVEETNRRYDRYVAYTIKRIIKAKAPLKFKVEAFLEVVKLAVKRDPAIFEM